MLISHSKVIIRLGLSDPLEDRVRVILRGLLIEIHSAHLTPFTPLDAHGQTEMCQAELRYHHEPAVSGKRDERAWGG